MPLVGNIRDFGLSDFLYLVDRGYKTGCLYLTHNSDHATLFFERGKLAYVSRKASEHARDILLLKNNKLPHASIETAIQRYEANGMQIPLTQYLANEQVIPADELQRMLQTHTEETMYPLFGWKEGEFRFEHGQKPPHQAPMLLQPIAVEHLIMEGVRRIDEWSRIRDVIPNSEQVVHFLDQPGEKARAIRLSPEEWRVFARINGTDSLAEIARRTGFSEFDVSRIVYGFITAGLAALQRQARTAPQTAVEAPAATKSATPVSASSTGIRKSLVARIIERIQKM